MDENDTALAASLRKLVTDPRSRDKAVRLLKEVDPESWPKFSFPDTEITALEEKVDEKLAALEAKRAGERVEQSLRAQKTKLLEKYSPEQVADIEKSIMEKHNIHDYEIAEKVYASDTPPIDPKRSPPPARFGERWTMPEQMEEFKKDPAAAALRGAYADIDRIQRGERLGG
jgi:hypothetical protein